MQLYSLQEDALGFGLIRFILFYKTAMRIGKRKNKRSQDIYRAKEGDGRILTQDEIRCSWRQYFWRT